MKSTKLHTKSYYNIEYVCMSVSLFFMHGHSFERIWTKFGVWLIPSGWLRAG